MFETKEYYEIKKMLDKGEYKKSFKNIRQIIDKLISGNEYNELVQTIKKFQFLILKTGDINQFSIFTKPVIKHIQSKTKILDEYIGECSLLNEYYLEIKKSIDDIIKTFSNMHQNAVLHLIISSFENNNHKILIENSDGEFDSFFHQYIQHATEINYQSNVEAINSILKRVIKERGFTLDKEKFEILYSENQEISTQMVNLFRFYNFINWLSDEISITDVKLIVNKNQINFYYNDLDEYKRKQIPLLRERSYENSTTFKNYVKIKSKFKWEKRDIDYEKIIEEVSGDFAHFKLKFTSDEFVEALKVVFEESYHHNLQFLNHYFITDIIDKKIKNMNINCGDTIVFYFMIKSIGIIYFSATKYYIEKYKRYPIAPYLAISRKEMSRLFTRILSSALKKEITDKEINSLILFYNFSSNDIYDLYYKPIITFEDKIIIVPSVINYNNFYKTYINHIQKLEIDISEKGDNYELCINAIFESYGFDVYNSKNKSNFSFKDKGDIVCGDLDLVMMKDNVLFLGQLKNNLDPIEPFQYLGIESKIKKAAKQINNSLRYLDTNPKELLNYYKINSFDEVSIYPFILINCFYGSGMKVEGIQVIDTSSLNKFLDGELRILVGDKVVDSKRLRKIGNITAQDLINFIENPYFLSEDLYPNLYTTHKYKFKDKTFMISPNIDIEQHLNNCWISKIANKELLDK